MVSRREYQQRAEECLQLANEATEVYVKVALSELATEFQKIADGVEPEPDRAGTRKQAADKRVAHKHAA
jgi:hypothetical protein